MGGIIFGIIAATLGWFVTGCLDFAVLIEWFSALFGG